MAALFVLTLITTSAAGARFAENFDQDRPVLVDDLFRIITLLFHPSQWANGLTFSLPLVMILLAHELGHYLTCRHYGIDVSPPYFLPFPSLIGTFGAFIRIRGPILTRRQLFDIGVSGPIAGFVFLVPVLSIGLAYSKVVPGLEQESDFVFGVPLLQRLLTALIFPGVLPEHVHLHPAARAAWVGLLATALNLLPIGQLDGGHILYAFVGRHHKLLTNLFILALIPLAIFYSRSWWIWAGLLFFLARKHPRIYDNTPPGRGRAALAILAIVLLILCFSPAPVRDR